MMDEAYAEFQDPDGNFLEQFQTTGFDSRCFELYLFAYLSRSGYTIKPRHQNPDFIVTRDKTRVALEATTVNPATSGVLEKVGKKISELTGPELLEYQRHELGIRFGSPLFSKLKKRYWELPHCQGIPLVFAIEAFHDEDALELTDVALCQFLYGLSQDSAWSAQGKLELTTQSVSEHSVEGKTIPSNFFGQEDAENVSAVAFTNSGTVAKFSRMGYQHGYGNEFWLLTRSGFSFVRERDAMDPAFFAYDVGQPPSVETWGQGIVVCHNPHARYPLPNDFFPDAVQQRIENGVFVSYHKGWHPFSSKTFCAYLGELKAQLPKTLLSRGCLAVGPITKTEFQSIIGINQDGNPVFDEHGWFSDESDSFFGVVIYDKEDKDWGFVILARDPHFAFRAIETGASLPSRYAARVKLQIRMSQLLRNPKRIFIQD